MFILIINEQDVFLDIELNNNIKSYVKGDKVYNHELQSFKDHISTRALRYVHTCIYT